MDHPEVVSDLPVKELVLRARGPRVVMRFRHLPGGTFVMGSRGYHKEEEPPHSVRISPFWMAETPVTQREFALWTQSRHYKSWQKENSDLVRDPHENSFKNQDNNPADNVTWFEADAYCHWIQSRCADKLSGLSISLPSKAQWEYACRAGTHSEYHTGDGEAALMEAGWFRNNSNSQTQEVKQKRPNFFGLYDMHGNVWEWCRDEWDADSYRRTGDNATDPVVDSSPRSNQPRVLRGGSWSDDARNCRSSSRGWFNPDFRGRFDGNWDIGFRVCLVPGPLSS